METLLNNISRIGSVLTDHIETSEQNGKLSQPAVNALRGEGIYKLFLPESLGGLEQDPLTVARITEQVARYNAAAGWSIMVANTGNWISKFLPERAIDEIFGNGNHPFGAGTFAVPVRAMALDGGFELSGQAKLCSHVHEAEWITLLAIVFENGQPRISNGRPELRGVVLRREDCEIVPTWTSFGMKGSDSNDVAVSNVFVPDHRTFIVSPYTPFNRYFSGPMYKFPVAGIISCSLVAPIALAIASNALKELRSLAGKMASGAVRPLQEKGTYQRKVAMAEALVDSSRVYLHHVLGKCADKIRAGEVADINDRANLLLAGTHAVTSCTQAVDLVYSAAGTTAIYSQNAISRHFTDMQVVRQHGFVNENRYETVSQLLFGMEPDFPPVML